MLHPAYKVGYGHPKEVISSETLTHDNDEAVRPSPLGNSGGKQTGTVPVQELFQANPYPDPETLMNQIPENKLQEERYAPPPHTLLPPPIYSGTFTEETAPTSAAKCAIQHPSREPLTKPSLQKEQEVMRVAMGQESKQPTLKGKEQRVYSRGSKRNQECSSAAKDNLDSKPSQRSSSIPEVAEGEQTTYKPYTLQEYKDKKTPKYQVLGGLGANVGGEEWKEKKEKRERMTDYAKEMQRINKGRVVTRTDRPPLPLKPVPVETELALQKKQRMLEYAKHIPKPPVPRLAEAPVRFCLSWQ